MSQEKKVVDWEAVELHYRAGIRSLVDIGKEYGISDSGIVKRAKRDKWTRDLKAKVRARAEAKVSASVVSAEVSAKRAANENDLVEANAEVQYRIRMNHRADLGRLNRVKNKMLDHLESVVDNFEDLGEVIALIREPDEFGQDRANDKLRKAMDRSDVIDDLKKLAEVDEKVRKGEREAFGIDDGDRGASPIDMLLAKINAAPAT